MYLFHLVKRMVDGRRMVVWADEFARLLADRSFAEFAKNGLEGWRKKDASLAILHAKREPRARFEHRPRDRRADADQDLLPEPGRRLRRVHRGLQPDAIASSSLVKEELEPGSRAFLIKQNHVSVVAKLDLQGFDFELDVISGRTANVELMNRLIAEHGPQPEIWLPRLPRGARGAQAPTGADHSSPRHKGGAA